MKSSTCFSKKTGRPLEEYADIVEARFAAAFEKRWNLYPYRCSRCGRFHLAPVESRINVQHFACSCTDSRGMTKALYLTLDDAERQRKKSEKEQGVSLRIYRCPHTGGYHLSHKFYVSRW